jgi:hypothetical protein
MWGKQGTMTVEKAKGKVRELLEKNDQIEKLVEEGKTFKRKMGWHLQS